MVCVCDVCYVVGWDGVTHGDRRGGAHCRGWWDVWVVMNAYGVRDMNLIFSLISGARPGRASDCVSVPHVLGSQRHRMPAALAQRPSVQAYHAYPGSMGHIVIGDIHEAPSQVSFFHPYPLDQDSYEGVRISLTAGGLWFVRM